MKRFLPRRSTLRLLLALGFCAGVVTVNVASQSAYADPRDDAKANYEQGKKLYASGDYKGAIAAFARAEQLSPSAFNDFNEDICVWSETKREVHP